MTILTKKEQKDFFLNCHQLEKYDKCSIKAEMSSLSFPVVLSVGVPRVSKQWEILHTVTYVLSYLDKKNVEILYLSLIA